MLQELALTFDDVLLVPSYSEVLPSEVEVKTKFSRNIELNIPIVSAAMDTVTESAMAIAMALQGGIGVIHRNLPPETQAKEVEKVKRFENIVIDNPITVNLNDTVSKAVKLMNEFSISGLPVVQSGKLAGIITRRDVRFTKDGSVKVQTIMTPLEKLITAPENTSLEKAKEIMEKHRVEKLPLVDSNGILKGLITMKDITKIMRYPQAVKDAKGRLRVAAAVGTSNGEIERAELLVKAGADALVVDTAHGHSLRVIESVKTLKRKFPDIDIVAGNVATEEGAKALVKAGADAVKVGIGPGSICTTRIVAGVGVPQITAIVNSAKALKNTDVPLIADGGIKFSGDIAKAIAAGADSVMLGNLLAGTTESPGELIISQGRRYKTYRGMGSIGAITSGSNRYPSVSKDGNKFVPEGIEGMVPFKGSVEDVLFQLVGGLKSAMGYCGVKNIQELKTKAKFVRITNAGLRESHPHDVTIIREAPNYTVEQKE